METQVAINWRAALERAQTGYVYEAAGCFDDNSEAANLFRGLLVFESEPELGKDLFAKAARSADVELANQAAIYEARSYEYLGQPEEGRILIRDVLKRDLMPHLRAHALFVLAVLQVSTPRRAMTTLNRIKIDDLLPGMKGRVYLLRGKVQSDLGKFGIALIEYAGAASFFEEAGHVQGVAHAYNNLASIYRRLKEFSKAHESVDTAIRLVSQTDPFIPQFLDQKAQIFLAEKNYLDAERIAIKAVGLVHGTNRQNVLCENLCTLGLAYAGLKNYPPAGATFASAKDIADRLDSPDLLLKVARSRRDAAQMVLRDSELEMAELALRLCGGSYRAAAKQLEMTHTGIIKLLKRSSRRAGTEVTTNSIYKPVK